MIKIKSKRVIAAALVVLPMLMAGNLARADEITGTLTTGLSGQSGNTVNGIVIIPPSANPSAGEYTSAQSVGLSAAGASSIHFTFDGSTPSCNDLLVYQQPIPVSLSMTIKAISCYPQNHSSSVASFAYTVNVSQAQSSSSGSSGGGSGGGGGVLSQQSSSAKAGDINLDTQVNEYDFGIMMSQWNTTASGLSGDLNKDGEVNEYDFSILMLHWGE